MRYHSDFHTAKMRMLLTLCLLAPSISGASEGQDTVSMVALKLSRVGRVKR